MVNETTTLTSEFSVLIPLGAILLLGLATEGIGRRTRLPRVTLLLLFGVLVGPSGFGLVTEQAERWFPLVADMTLAMIGFLLGGKLTRQMLEQQGRVVVWLSMVIVLVTLAVVAGGLWVLGVPMTLALLLGAISTSTDPAATIAVVQEYRASGRFTDLLLGIVAVDDALGLIVFSIVLVVAQLINDAGYHSDLLLHSFWDIGGAIALGVALGVPMAYMTGRIRPGEPILVEAVGTVFFCAGLALWLEVSYLLAAMAMGATVTNLAHHHTRPFHAIEDIEWPFLIVFFVLSGASVSLPALAQLGWLGAGYVVMRVLGRLCGGFLAGLSLRKENNMSFWIGLAMLPQAGVALAMVFTAVQLFPTHRDVLLPLVIGATIVFELVGPIATRLVLAQLGETRRADDVGKA